MFLWVRGLAVSEEIMAQVIIRTEVALMVEAVARKAVNQERRWTRHTLRAGEGEELDILRAGNEALLADRQAPERQVRSLREGVSELREVERERVGEMNWPV